MAFTYTAGSGVARDQVRLLISDTREQDLNGNTVYVFEDEELDEFVALGVSVYGAASLALRSLSAEHARTLTVRMGIAQGGVTVSTAEASERIAELADKFESLDSANVDAVVLDWRGEDTDYAKLLNEGDLYRPDDFPGVEFS